MLKILTNEQIEPKVGISRKKSDVAESPSFRSLIGWTVILLTPPMRNSSKRLRDAR